MNVPKALFVVLAFAGLSLPSFAYAATLSLSPANTSASVGQTVTVNVLVSSSDQAVNALSGTIAFPADKLQVVSVGKSNSIVSFWVQDPSFSNTEGTVNFEGVITNPGFTGVSAKVMSVTFKALSMGTAPVSFSIGSVLANDGNGTELLSNSTGSNIAIQAASAIAPAPVPTGPVVSVGEVAVSSPTHPDQTKWYANSSPQFAWSLPPDALEVRTNIGTSSATVPNVSYIPAISTKTASNEPDGAAYFSLRVRTSNGWSPVSRYVVNIDTVAPKPFTLSILPYDAQKGVQAQFSTTDELSGIDHYELLVDGEIKGEVTPDEARTAVTVPTTDAGTKTLTVVAYDKAGNTTSASAPFGVPAAGPSILSVLWLIVSYLVAVLLILGMVGGLAFVSRYLWRKMRDSHTRTTPVTTDAAHKELTEIHHQLLEVVDELDAAGALRELTSEEKRIVKRINNLGERSHHVKVQEVDT